MLQKLSKYFGIIIYNNYKETLLQVAQWMISVDKSAIKTLEECLWVSFCCLNHWLWGGVWALGMKPFTKMNFHISTFFILQSTMDFGLIFLFSFKYIYVEILRVSGYPRIPGLTHAVSMFLFVSMFFSIRRKCCKELQNSETKGKMGTRWISLLFSSLQRRKKTLSARNCYKVLGFHHSFRNIAEVGWTKIGLRFSCSNNVLKENGGDCNKSSYMLPFTLYKLHKEACKGVL